MTPLGIDRIIGCMQSRGYRIFRNDNKPCNLNIVGVRSRVQKANKFDDLMYVYWYHDNHLNVRIYECTTDPGTYWLKKPMNIDGTAILVPVQYLRLWKSGLHRGRYSAFIQKAPCKVYRDNNKNDILDYDVPMQEGMFGINLHKAGSNSKTVDRWSAGCQVIRQSKRFEELIRLRS